MAQESIGDITAELLAWNRGDEKALNRLVSTVYPELRKIARQHLRRGSDCMLV